MGLTNCVQKWSKRPFQLDHDRFVIGGRPGIHSRAKRLAKRVPLRPAGKACRAVLCSDRLSVMELEPVAEGDPPFQAVFRNGMTGRHLRFRFLLGVHTVERVEH